MRSHNIFPAAALAACLFAGLAGCGGKSAYLPEDLAEEFTEQPRAEAVTPASDRGAGAALAAAGAASRPVAGTASEASPAFPGQADMLPTTNAVNDFCARPGSLAFMTRDGCRAALSRFSQGVSGSLHFNSLDECRNFLQERRNSYDDIVAEHRAWCRETFANPHDRKGCFDAAPVFLNSFTEQGFCRAAPPAAPAPAPEKELQEQRGFEAPYIKDYSEPGQKFDQPRTGRLPGAATPASAASGKKGVSAPAPVSPPARRPVAAKPAVPPTSPAPAVPPVIPAPPAAPAPTATPTPAPAATPTPAPAATVPAPEASPAAPAALEAQPPSTPPASPAPAVVPAWPSAPDFSNASEPRPEAQSGQPSGQSLDATTGQNAVSPEAVPEAIRATLGGQVEPAAPQPAPAAPAPPAPVQELSAPFIGNREEIIPLPPVPSIGRIAPPLVPGVPPDTAVTESTLPAPPTSEPVRTMPVPPDPVDAFSGAIPNFVPPAAPEDAGAQPMPLSGTPAGQAAP